MSEYPTLISIENVSKRFTIHQDKSLKDRLLHPSSRSREDFWALRDISLEIPMNSSVGLMGHNGSGKSTLLKVIGSIIQPSTGRVRHRGRVAALLELGAGFHQDLTGRENIFLNASILGMSKEETLRCIDDIIDFSGIGPFIDTQVKFYSSGMYVRLAFAVAIHADPDILLVDEVLAVGDEPFQRKCMDKIREFQAEGRTIILVSHSADQVGSVCDRAVVLDHGSMVFDGDTQDAIHILREGFQEEESQERSAQKRGETGTQRLARIEEVTVCDDSGRPVDQVGTDDDLLLMMTVVPETRLSSWMAAMAIETTLGQMLFRFDTHAADQELPAIDRPSRVEFRLPRLSLGDGAYTINVGIGDEAGATIDRIAPALTLNVRGPYVGTGPVGLRPTIRVLDI